MLHYGQPIQSRNLSKNYLLENSVAAAVAFIIRAPLATREPWSLFEPHPRPRGRRLGQTVRAAFFAALREGQPLSETQAIVCKPSWPGRSLRLFYPLPPFSFHPPASSASHGSHGTTQSCGPSLLAGGMWVSVVAE